MDDNYWYKFDAKNGVSYVHAQIYKILSQNVSRLDSAEPVYIPLI